MRRLLWLVCLLAMGAFPAFAQNSKLAGWCENGSVAVAIPGTQGSGNQRFQQSYPSCTVTVYNGGTVTPATIFSDAIGTAKANPFTATTQGQWFFYGVPGNHYDVRLSGGGIPVPFTLGDQTVPAVTSVTGSFTSGRIPYTTGATSLADTPNLIWNGVLLGITGNLTTTGNIGVRGVSYSWPALQGAASTVLSNDGFGNLTWAAGGGGGGTITGSGTTGTIPIFTGANAVGNSLITSDGARYVTVTANNSLGASTIMENTDNASASAYSQFTALDGSAGGQNNVSMGVTSAGFVGAPLTFNQAYIQSPATNGLFTYTTNLAPLITGINNTEVARWTADTNPVLSLGSITADDQAQIRIQAIRNSTNGNLIETRNTNVGATAYASFVAADAATGGTTNNMQMGVTSAGFSPTGGVSSLQGFIESAAGATNGIVIQTRSASNIVIQPNQVEALAVTPNGINVRTVPYTWPSGQGSASTVLTNNGSGVLTWASAGTSGTGVSCGTCTTNRLTKVTGASQIGDSLEFDDGTTFYVNKASGGSSQILLYGQKNQNDKTYLRWENTNAGTLSQATMIVTSDQSNGNMQMGTTSSGFTTANGIPAAAGFIYSGTDNTGGLFLQSGAGSVFVNPAGTNIATFTNAGAGIGGAPDQVLTVSKNQNAVTYLDVKNTTAGTTAAAEIYAQADLVSSKTYLGTTSSTFTTAQGIPSHAGFVSSDVSNTAGLFLQALAGSSLIHFQAGGSTDNCTLASTGTLTCTTFSGSGSLLTNVSASGLLGAVPIVNGGTGTTSFTSGRLPYYNGSTLVDSVLSQSGATAHVVSNSLNIDTSGQGIIFNSGGTQSSISGSGAQVSIFISMTELWRGTTVSDGTCIRINGSLQRLTLTGSAVTVSGAC